MADVFISYSRRDREFVQRLHEALAARQRDTWVDWEDIPPTAEWLKEIFAAIEGAHAFLFILSPDSAASPVCQKELAHAAANNKRLIPMVRREVSSKDVPESLFKLNWIFLREGDDFDAGIEKLLEAVDTDLDWVKAHTRLLTRALEWDRQSESRHKKSLLLRGADLKNAETWLASSGDQEPRPTDLQRQYILASRQGEKRETRRKRRLLAGLLIGMVLLAIAAPVAVYQYRLSLSRYLAAQSQNLLEGQHIDLSLLLSVEACRAYKTQEAKEALVSALQKEPRLKTIFHQNYVQGMAFSPDGETLISASAYNFILILGLEDPPGPGAAPKGRGRFS